MSTPTAPGPPPLSTPWSRSHRLVPRTVLRPLARFCHTEVASGVVLLAAAAVALVWANSPWASGYEALLHTEVGLEVGSWSLQLSLHHLVNDALMAVFFAVVGLEIKRELVHGQLRDRRAALVPVLAAVGGMAVPAALFLAFNLGGPAGGGWGVPMATDIAFALGVLALAGSRVPAGLKVFLLTLAVADDIGAIAVIAVFYSSGVAVAWLATAAAALALVVVAQRRHVRHLGVYGVLAVVAWYALLQSGVHATIAGVAVGLLTPATPFHRPAQAARVVRARLRAVEGDQATPLSDDAEHDEAVLLDATAVLREAVSPLARLEAALHRWSAFVILPVFALANAGVHVSGDALATPGAAGAALGVAAGLLVGKPLGVVAATWLAVRLGLGRLPEGVGTAHLLAVGLVAGVGFTVALFVAGLAFPSAALTDAAKLGILGGSALAGVGGYALLRLAGRPTSAGAPVTPAPAAATASLAAAA